MNDTKVPLTAREKLGRAGLILATLAAVAGLGYAVSRTPEIDANGNPEANASDPGDVVFSGDGDLLGDLPPAPVPGEAAPEVAGAVEQLIPAQGAEALRQQQVGIDLGPRYTGVLVVNGVTIPEEELIRRPELNQVFFQPGSGFVIDEFPAGRNCVTAIFWREAEGRANSRTVDWCFEVT